MSLFATSLVDRTTLSTACFSATPDSGKNPPSALRRCLVDAGRELTPAAACLRRKPPPPPLLPLPLILADGGEERKESVGPRDRRPAARASIMASCGESNPRPWRFPRLAMVSVSGALPAVCMFFVAQPERRHKAGAAHPTKGDDHKMVTTRFSLNHLACLYRGLRAAPYDPPGTQHNIGGSTTAVIRQTRSLPRPLMHARHP